MLLTCAVVVVAALLLLWFVYLAMTYSAIAKASMVIAWLGCLYSIGTTINTATATLVGTASALAYLFYGIAERIRRELYAANLNLSACRLLLRDIAENMQRGPHVDLDHLCRTAKLREAMLGETP